MGLRGLDLILGLDNLNFVQGPTNARTDRQSNIVDYRAANFAAKKY